MSTADRRTEAYLKEAELSIESAKAAFERAENTGKDLWHATVKSSYDAMEQAISAVLAREEIEIPKSHPAKVEKFVNKFGESNLTEKIRKWLGKRSRTQYVDVERGEVVVPHKIFDETDAKDALDDAEFVVERINDLLSEN